MQARWFSTPVATWDWWINMKPNHEQMNVETAPGLVDVYDDDVTSFSMHDPNTVSVKHRIDGDIAIEYDIKVV